MFYSNCKIDFTYIVAPQTEIILIHLARVVRYAYICVVKYG